MRNDVGHILKAKSPLELFKIEQASVRRIGYWFVKNWDWRWKIQSGKNGRGMRLRSGEDAMVVALE